MSIQDLFTPSSMLFLIAGAYLAALTALKEAGILAIVPAVFCFVAFVLGFWRKSIVSGAWRLATSVFVLVLFISQVLANAQNLALADYVSIISLLVNGILFVLFVGMFLLSFRVVTAHNEGEEGKEGEETVRVAEK